MSIPIHRPSSADCFLVTLRAIFLLLCAGFAGLCATTSALAQAEPGTAAAELEQIARALRALPSTAGYARLATFAEQHAQSELGSRAALALGYHDHARKRYVQAHRWLARAERDALLREYALYWNALALRALGHSAAAADKLQALRSEYPSSVMTEPAVEALAAALLASGRARAALEALAAYDKTDARPALLLLRARANQLSGAKEFAVADYAAIYYPHSLTAQATEAGKKLAALRQVMGKRFPAISA